MELNFEVADLSPFPALPEPSMLFPTIYFDENMYASSVPHCLFAENVFIPNGAQISSGLPAKDCLNLLASEPFYILLNQISVPKKAKKPADGYSYPELLFEPAVEATKLYLDIYERLGTENGIARIDQLVTLPIGQGSTVSVRISGTIPDYAEFQELSFAIAGVRIRGNLGNLQCGGCRGLPPCGWECDVRVPGLEPLLLRNGYLVRREHEVDAGDSGDSCDIFVISRDYDIEIVFPCEAMSVDAELCTQGFEALYQQLGDSKQLEKQRETEEELFLTKSVQDLARPLTEHFTQIVNTLRDAVEASLTAAQLSRAEEEPTGARDKKKSEEKTEQKAAPSGITLRVEKMPSLLERLECKNNYARRFLDDTEIDALRGLGREQALVTVRPSAVFTHMDVKPEDFECVAYIPLRRILSDKVLLCQAPLEQTEQQRQRAESAAQAGVAEPKHVKQTEGQQKKQPSENILATNYALIGVGFDLSRTRLVRSSEYIAQTFREKLIQQGQLVNIQAPLVQQMLFSQTLPPSRDVLANEEVILQQFGQQAAAIYRAGGDYNQQVQQLALQYVEQLKIALPQAEDAEIHARLMIAAKAALACKKTNKKSPSELIAFGNELLKSCDTEDAERAKMLFGRALARERASNGDSVKSTVLEEAILGSLRCAIATSDELLIKRNICRTFQAQQLGNLQCIDSLDLTFLAAGELAASGVELRVILLFLSFYQAKGFKILNGDCVDERETCENLLYLTFILIVFEEANDPFAGELGRVIVSCARENNKGGRLFRQLSDSNTDSVYISSLKLALAQYFIRHGSAEFAQAILNSVDLGQEIEEKKEECAFKFDFRPSGQEQCGCEAGGQNESALQHADALPGQESGLLEQVGRALYTKRALLQARVFYRQNKLTEMRNILTKKQFHVKKLRNEQNNPLNLLAQLQAQGNAHSNTSFFDLFDDGLDQVPGLLATFALSVSQNDKIPQFLYYKNRAPQVLVAAAINDQLPSKINLTVTTANQTQADLGRKAAIQLIASMKKKFQTPPQMIIAPQTIADLQGMTFEQVIYNSRIGYEMINQALSLEQLSCQNSRYSGLLDCSETCQAVSEDSAVIIKFAELAVQYLPLFKLLEFKAPFLAPGNDEIQVATRLFSQIKDELICNNEGVEEQSEQCGSEQLTTDYLSKIQLRDPIQICECASSLIAQLLSNERFQSPKLIALYGQLMLRLNMQEQALNCFERALELNSVQDEAWCGIALYYAVQCQKDNGKLDKMREKIIESLERMRKLPGSYTAIAIAQSLLNDNSEIATQCGIMAKRLLENECYAPLMPIVEFNNVQYNIDFANAQQTQWYVQRLLALASQTCGSTKNVAQYLQEALIGLGGAKPGRSVPEIAERILLMTETSHAWAESGDIENSEKIVEDGLTI